MPKGCRHFAGMVNFLSMFCLELQRILKPIYDSTKKVDILFGEKNKRKAFEKIKRRLVKAPELHMPNHEGRF